MNEENLPAHSLAIIHYQLINEIVIREQENIKTTSILRDQYEYIDYFIYELDYGRKYETGMVTDENGQDIDIHTPNLLYDFISNNGVMCQKEV